MSLRVRSLVFAVIVLLGITSIPAHAQLATTGKGWLLDTGGVVTSAPNEVISGRTSVKGSQTGTTSYTGVLVTDLNFIKFTPGQTYAIAFNYRVLTTLSEGLSYGFFSSTGSQNGHYLNNPTLIGSAASAGASGTASGSMTIGSESDYQIQFKIVGSGVVVLDDVRVTNAATGQLVASENAEGPTLAPGPLNFQVTDAMTLLTEASGKPASAVSEDLDGDGYPEVIVTNMTPRPSTTPTRVIVIEASGKARLASTDFFPAGVPTVKDSPMTVLADLNGDGLKDIVFSEAGGDPFGEGRISVALNLGDGKYRDVSDLIPADQQNTRSYAVVVGDVLGDGHVSIVLPDENNGANTALLRWNGNGFDEIRNWISPAVWQGSFGLHQQSWMNLADFDLDGRLDLLSSGQQNAPNIRLAFGARGGFSTAGVVIPPDGPWGHFDPGARPPAAQGAEVQPIVVADFNNDGVPDIFAAERKVVEYQPGAFSDTTDPDYANLHANGGAVYSDDSFQVLINHGARKFTDATAPNYINLGDRTYYSLLPADINNDGFLDIVGLFELSFAPGVRDVSGTTFFLNDGTGVFQAVDGATIIGATTAPSNGRVWNLGSFVPTRVTPDRTEGVVIDYAGGCGPTLGFCAPTRLNIYKVVANGSIGTGPGLANSAKLGVPGFNEFFYLRTHPDAAEAVRSGRYRSGLDHYLAEGMSKGYETHAPRARLSR